MAPHINEQHLADEYGWSLSFLNSNPELKNLFQQAVRGTWSPAQFVARLRDTSWFKNKSSSYRNYLVNKSMDPGSWQADFNRTHAMIADAYGSLWGGAIPPHLGDRWTQRAMMFGWSDAEIKDHIVGTMNARHQIFQGGVGGQAAQLKDQIQGLIKQYGVEPSQVWQANQIKSIMMGNNTIDGATDQIRSWAEKRYSAFADEIKSGKTVQDLADPYIQSMAQLLELNPNHVDIQDKTIQQAMTRMIHDDKSKQSKQVPMSLTAFQDMVRADPRWDHTQQAHDQYQSIAAGLLQNWGLMA